MRNYKVTFFRINPEDKEDIKHLGFVYVDDYGTHDHFTVEAKAFRHCAPVCLMANKVLIEQV